MSIVVYMEQTVVTTFRRLVDGKVFRVENAEHTEELLATGRYELVLPTLTRAAKRDLATLRAGGTVDFRLGPMMQLRQAGLIDDHNRLI